MSNIAVLTSGGDSPGMNAAVMAVARSATLYGMPLIGIKHGYNGLLRKSTNIHDDLQELVLDTVLDIADVAGFFLEHRLNDAVMETCLPEAEAWHEVCRFPTQALEIGRAHV